MFGGSCGRVCEIISSSNIHYLSGFERDLFLYPSISASTPTNPTCAFATPTYTPIQLRLHRHPIQISTSILMKSCLLIQTIRSSNACKKSPHRSRSSGLNPTLPHNHYRPIALSSQFSMLAIASQNTKFGMVLPGKGFVVDSIPYNLTKNKDKPTQITIATLAHRTIDTVTFPSLTGTPLLATGNSYARIPDGSSSWQTTNQPTLGNSNMSSRTKNSQKQSSQKKLKASQTPSTKSKKTLPPDTTEADNTETTETQLTQPQWQTLRFPRISPPQPVQTSTLKNGNNHRTTPTTTNSATTIPDKFLLTFLFIALFATLQWSWRYFLPT